MKHFILISLAFIQVFSMAQAVPNGTFENWNIIPYSNPTGFSTGNTRDIHRFGAPSVTKVAGLTGSAVRIETMVAGNGDVSESYMLNIPNPCGDPQDWTGGVPFNQKATSLVGYYRYNLPGTDTAIAIVVFLKNGVQVSMDLFKIKGTGSQPTFTTFSFPLSLTVVPDSVIIAFASTNKLLNMGAQNGGYIEIDNLSFAGTTIPIPNGDFESWGNNNYEDLSGWDSWGEGVSRTTDKVAGSYAVKLTTMQGECDNGNPNATGITSGKNDNNMGPSGGKPYTKILDTLTGFYKYAPVGNDSAYILVTLSKNSSPVGSMIKFLTAKSTYTYFEIPFAAGLTPDTIRIDISSSMWNITAANLGSVLIVDHIQLKSQALGITDVSGTDAITIYPNPVGDRLSVFLGTTEQNKTIRIVNSLGQTLETFSTADKTLTVDTKDFPSGVYYLQVQTGNAATTKTFIK